MSEDFEVPEVTMKKKWDGWRGAFIPLVAIFSAFGLNGYQMYLSHEERENVLLEVERQRFSEKHFAGRVFAENPVFDQVIQTENKKDKVDVYSLIFGINSNEKTHTDLVAVHHELACSQSLHFDDQANDKAFITDSLVGASEVSVSLFSQKDELPKEMIEGIGGKGGKQDKKIISDLLGVVSPATKDGFMYYLVLPKGKIYNCEGVTNFFIRSAYYKNAEIYKRSNRFSFQVRPKKTLGGSNIPQVPQKPSA